MGLLSGWKEKREQEEARAREEERRRQEQEQKEKASAVRSGAEDILFELDGIRYVSRNGRIAEEKLEEYRQVVGSLRTLLRHAPTMAMDVSGVDERITKLITLFKQAIENENEKTASRALSMIAYGIKEARAQIHATSKEQEAKIIESRTLRLDRMIALAELSGEVDSLDVRIAKLDRDYEEKKAEYADAYACCERTVKDYPELVIELNDCIAGNKPISGAALCLNTQKKEVIDLYNIVNNIRRVQANMKARQEEYQANINVLELQLRESSDLQAEQISETLRQMQADFQESMRRSQNEMEELSGVTEHFNKLLDSIFASQSTIDRILRTDMAYEKIVRREQEIEEGRRLAQELEQEQREQNQNEHGRLLN